MRSRLLVLAVAAGALVSPLLPSGSPAASAATGSARAIRAVDFRNGFSYDLGDSGKVTVTNGSFERGGDPSSGEVLYLDVIDVDHGDLTGDGIEEAVVTLSQNTGGTGQFTWSQVYRMSGGRPVLVTETGVGDRASDGVHDVIIVNGQLVDERYGGDQGACCPTLIEQRTFRLRTGGGLVLVGNPKRRAYVYAGVGEPTPVSFLRGTTSATVMMEQGATATVDARKGQQLTVSMPGVRAGRSALVVAVRRPDGSSLGSVKAPGSLRVVLPSTGEYRLVAAAGQSFGPVDVAIR